MVFCGHEACFCRQALFFGSIHMCILWQAARFREKVGSRGRAPGSDFYMIQKGSDGRSLRFGGFGGFVGVVRVAREGLFFRAIFCRQAWCFVSAKPDFVDSRCVSWACQKQGEIVYRHCVS